MPNCGLRIQLHQTTPALQADIDRLNELWAEGLERFGGPFLTGSEFTAVDAFFCPLAFLAQTYNLPLHAPYIQQIIALKSMQAWYASARQVSWRADAYERESLADGVVLLDRRIND